VCAKRVRSDRPLTLSEIVHLFEGTADGVYVVDADQRIVAWNASAERLLGSTPQQVLGRPCYEVIAGSDYEGHAFCRQDCPVAACTRRGQIVPNYDILARAEDAGGRWLNVSIVVVRAAEYSRPLAVHLFRDVSKRRQAEVLARHAELLARQVVAETGAAAVTTRPQGDLGPYPAPEPSLTRRELDVLRLLASNGSVREIARDLGISQTTVRNHIENLLSKLGVHSRLQAILYAAGHNLL
jgi:PAS domain S-box-containing protein